jgi:hypothetical protein
MAEKDGKRSWVMVNRAPVLTLWAAVVAEVWAALQKRNVSPIRMNDTCHEHIHRAD